MPNPQNIYRLLQQHLDKQPVGFPAARSGADLKLLEILFTPDEAQLALHLSYQPNPTPSVVASAASSVPAAEVERLLQSMFNKGSIARQENDGERYWYVVPLVVGMYEFQGGALSREFMKAAGAYMQTLAYGKSLLAVKPSQMRTIPVNKSISAEHHVAPYDEIRAIVMKAAEPFVVIDCICRASAKRRRQACKKTARSETCLAFGDMAAMAISRSHGRKISKDEALTILAQNEEDGLVCQPAGVQDPQFICSCCGCCCGMLGMQKKIPRPVDFWTSSFYVEVENKCCIRCGNCVKRCQVNAVTMSGSGGAAKVNLQRCIGCGLCVSSCGPKALTLVKKRQEPILPKDEEALNEEIKKNKKSALGEWIMMLKIMVGL